MKKFLFLWFVLVFLFLGWCSSDSNEKKIVITNKQNISQNSTYTNKKSIKQGKITIETSYKYLWNGWFTIFIKTNLTNFWFWFKIYSESAQIGYSSNDLYSDAFERLYMVLLDPKDKNYIWKWDEREPTENYLFHSIKTNSSGEWEISFYLYTEETYKHSFSEIETLMWSYSDNQYMVWQLLNARKTFEKDWKIIVSLIINSELLKQNYQDIEMPDNCRKDENIFDCRVEIVVFPKN